MADAGWYPDPHDPGSEAYFDGQNWTGQRRAAAPSAPQPAPLPAPEWSAPPSTGWAGPTPQSGQPTGQPGQLSQGYPTTAYAAPGYPSQGYPTQGYPTQGNQPAGPAGGWQPGAPSWQGAPPPQRRRSRKPLLITLAAVVVLVAAGLVTWLVWPSSSPQFTYQGKEVSEPAKVLTRAETNVRALVKSRHGAENGNTRCYFAQPAKPASGAKKSDIEQALRCGPVLFVDGDTSQPYLSVPFTATTKDDKAILAPRSSLNGLEPAALGSGVKLVRPDGKQAPKGSGGLKVPAPPPAEKDVLTTASLGPTPEPATLDNARIVGKDTGVRLEAAGQIARYGSGDDARSAPAGEKLIAFQLALIEGDVSGSGTARPQLVVPGGATRSIPETTGSDEWVIVAVPSNSTPVLQLADAGYTQTLTLPDGKAGANNLAVLARSHRTQTLSFGASVPIKLSRGGRTASATWHATATFASLDYWIPNHEDQHARDPHSAVLSMALEYTDPDSPGKTYGFDPALLQLKITGGGTVHARNVAAANKIFDVFDVPASFTGGTVYITGSEKVQGITVRVAKAVSFPVSFAAG